MNSLIIKENLNTDICLIQMNRKEKRNALSVALLKAIQEAFTTMEAEGIRVAIIKGKGPVFSAGLDLSEASNEQEAHICAQNVAQTLNTFAHSPVISIGAAHGAALAGGAGLLSACDIGIATQECKIGYPETKRGMIAGLVMSFLVRQVGERRARDLLLTGRTISGTTAERWGLITEAVEQEALLSTAVSLAEQVIQGAPNATFYSKQLIDQLRSPKIGQDIEKALDHHMKARSSKEAEEGIAAFLEKREPNWSTFKN